MLDYDDLLLYWFHLLGDETLVTLLNERFDPVRPIQPLISNSCDYISIGK